MFFSKKKKRKRFLCLRILCFFGIKGNYSVPQTVMSNYLNTTICFDMYGWHALKIQKLSNSTPWAKSFCPFRAYWVISTVQVELFSVSYKLFFLLL